MRSIFWVPVILGALVILSPSVIRAADSSNMEIADRFDIRKNDNYTLYMNRASFKYYLAPLAQENVPLVESAFIGKNGSISFFGDYSTVRSDATDASRLYGFGGEAEYIFDIPIAVKGGIYASRQKMGFKDPSMSDNTNTFTDMIYSGSVGYYFADRFRVDAKGAYHTKDLDISTPSGSMTMKFSDLSYYLAAKYVAALSADMSLNMEGLAGVVAWKTKYNSSTSDGSYRKLGINADLYVTPRLGAGAGLLSISGDAKGSFVGDEDNIEGTEYIVRGSWFITEAFSVSADFRYLRAKEKSDTTFDQKKASIRGAFRF